MKRRLLGLVLGVVVAASSCDRGPADKPALRSEERTLVDLYVDITKLESLRADLPDSVGPGLDRLAATADTVAVRRALDGLRKDPSRWAIVYDEIAQRLRAAEESTDPGARLPSGSAVPVPRVSD